MESQLTITILAAGEGKRMRSNIPKVLHLFKGKPMLVRVIETALCLKPNKLIVVTGKYHNLIKETLSKYINIENILFVKQTAPLGTGHAVRECLPYYSSNEWVLILNGDMPLINQRILENFLKTHCYMCILVAMFSNPKGYGRIVYNEMGEFTEIVEEKDCDFEQSFINVVNSGIYFINSQLLLRYITNIDNNNAQNEYYLTDIVKIIRQNEKFSIGTFLIDKNENKYISGVNTPEELEVLENNSYEVL
jgi:bifunctional UDP-N-acetylglucosamine pyrophosphorylase/glucosamine-1-phosphate N-acetyltransferase